MGTAKSVEDGPKVNLSIYVLVAVVIVGYGLITLLLSDQVSGLVGLVFLIFAILGWGIWLGLYQSRQESHAKTK